MGLDIFVTFDNAEDFLYDHEFEDDDAWKNKHEVSRTFCNLLFRKDVVEGTPELDQIADKLDLDVSILYLMMNYWTEDRIDEALEFDEELEEDEFRESCRKENEKIESNIDSLIVLLQQISDYLVMKKNISDEMNDHGFNTLGSAYFTNLDKLEPVNYIKNNLNQDLTNLIRMAQFGKSNGAKTIYFELG
jgi:hypothetical protein